MRAAHGSGSQRLYSFRDILVLKVVKRLLDTGISLQQIRAAVQHLRDRGSADLAQVTLMSDGVSVYECTSADEVVDLLAGGQGVFGIALGRVWREVEGDLAVLPAVRAEDGLVAVPPGGTGFRTTWPSAACAVPAETATAVGRPRVPQSGPVSGTIGDADDTGRESHRVDAGAEGATSPEPLRHTNRAGQAALKRSPGG